MHVRGISWRVLALWVIARVCISPPAIRAQEYKNYFYDDGFHMGGHLVPSPRIAHDSLHFDFSQNYVIDLGGAATNLGTTYDCSTFTGDIFTDPNRSDYWTCLFGKSVQSFWRQADSVGMKVLFVPSHANQIAENIRAQENYPTLNWNMQVLELGEVNTTPDFLTTTPLAPRNLLIGFTAPTAGTRTDAFMIGTPRYATDPTMTALRVISPNWYTMRSSPDSSTYYRFTVTLLVDRSILGNENDTLAYVRLFYRDRRFQDTCKCSMYSPFGYSVDYMKLDTLFITRKMYTDAPISGLGIGSRDISWLINMVRDTITTYDTVTTVEPVGGGTITETHTSLFKTDSIVGRVISHSTTLLSKTTSGGMITAVTREGTIYQRFWVPIAGLTNGPFPEGLANPAWVPTCSTRVADGWFGPDAVDESGGSFEGTDFIFKLYTTRLNKLTFYRSRISPHMYDVFARGDLDSYIREDIGSIYTNPALDLVKRNFGRLGVDDEPIHPGLRADGLLLRKVQEAMEASNPGETRGTYNNPQTNMDGFRILTGDLDDTERKRVQVMAEQSYRVIASYRTPVTYANPDSMDATALSGLYRSQDGGGKFRRIAYNSLADYQTYTEQSQESPHGPGDTWGFGKFLDYRNNDIYDDANTRIFGPLVPFLARAVDVAQFKYRDYGPKTAVWNVLMTMGWNPALPAGLQQNQPNGAFDNEFDLRIPTPEEIVAQAWLTMNCGARGLIFGDMQWDNENLGVMDPFTFDHSVEYGAMRSPNGSLDTVKYHYPKMWVGMKSRFEAIREVAGDLHRIDSLVGWKNLIYNQEQMSVHDDRQTFASLPMLDTLYTRHAWRYAFTGGGDFKDTAAVDPKNETYAEVTQFSPGIGDTASRLAGARYLLITNRRLWPSDTSAYSAAVQLYGGASRGLGNIDVRRPVVRFKNGSNVIADSMLVEKVGASPAWSKKVKLGVDADLDWLKPGRGALYRVTPIPARGVSDYGTAYNNGIHAVNASTAQKDTDRVVVYERDSTVYLRAMDRHGVWGPEVLVSDAIDTLRFNTQIPARRRSSNMTPTVALVHNGASCMVVWERRDSINRSTVEARYYQTLPTTTNTPASTRLRLSAQRVVNQPYRMTPAVVGVDSGYAVAWATPTSGIEFVAIRDNATPTLAADVSLVSKFFEPMLVLSELGQLQTWAVIDSLSQFPSLAYCSNYWVPAHATNSLTGSFHFVSLAYQQGRAPAGPFIVYRPIGVRFTAGGKPLVTLMEPGENVTVNMHGCSFQHPSIAVDSFRVSVAFESRAWFERKANAPAPNQIVTLRNRRQPWGGLGNLLWNMATYYWGDSLADHQWPSLTMFPKLTSTTARSRHDGGLAWVRSLFAAPAPNEMYLYRYGDLQTTRLPNGKYPSMMLVPLDTSDPFASTGVFYRGDDPTAFQRPRFLGGNGVYYPARLEHTPLVQNPAFTGGTRNNGRVFASATLGNRVPPNNECSAYARFFAGFWINRIPGGGSADPSLDVPYSFNAETSSATPFLLDTISKASLIAATAPFTSDRHVRIDRVMSGEDSIYAWLNSAPYDSVTGKPANIFVVTELVRAADSVVLWRSDTISARAVGYLRHEESEVIPVDSVASDTTQVFIRLAMMTTRGLQYTLSAGFHFSNDTVIVPFKQAIRRVEQAERPTETGSASLRLSVVPNPTNGAGELRIATGHAGMVRVAIYDVMGRLVKTMDDLSVDAAGQYAVDLDLADLSQGRYTVQVVEGGERSAVQVVLVR